MKIFNKVDNYEILKKGEYGTAKYRKALEKAYMSGYDINVEKAKSLVVFSQGYGREIKVPLDIVEDVLGVKVA